MAERSVMAQIFVFGRVMNDLVPKESQSKQSYVCFDLMEQLLRDGERQRPVPLLGRVPL